MDTPRERALAALLGGSGSLVGIGLYQVLPDLGLLVDLQLRLVNAFAFTVVIFLVGSTGGYLGHRWFVTWTGATYLAKAAVVGGTIGLAISAMGWSITFAGRDFLFPFVPFDGMSELWRRWLLDSLLAGPIGGVMVSLAVVRYLKRVDARVSVEAR